MQHCVSEITGANLRRRTRYAGVFLFLLAAFCAIVVLNINIGSVPIPVSKIAKIIFTGEGDARQVAIIWKIRLPRILMAAILGGALSLLVSLGGLLLAVGLITLALQRRKEYRARQDDPQEDFVSFYDKENRVE